MTHGEFRAGRAWCAACQRWCEAEGPAGQLLFTVEHAHGASVTAPLETRRALLRSRARLAHPLGVGNVVVRQHLVALVRENQLALERWRVS